MLEKSESIAVLSEQLLVVGDELCPYQTVELRGASGNRTALFSRYLPPNGKQWLQHGLYQQFYPSGSLASEGSYRHGLAEGRLRDLHENGELAAQGYYHQGEHVGTWRFWDTAGLAEASEQYPPAPPEPNEP